MRVTPGAVEGELTRPAPYGDARAGQVDQDLALVARRRREVGQAVSRFIPLDVRMAGDPLEADCSSPGRSRVQECPDALCQG